MNIKLSSLNKGLVGHWTMSQDSLKGSLLADKTPYSNDGTIYGATFATDRMGQPNKAMSFDGVNDYIDCGNDKSLNIANNISISFWFNNPSIPVQYGSYINKYQTVGGKRSWAISYDGGIRSYWSKNGVLNNNTTIYPININQWYHAVYTFESGIVKTYIDGKLKYTDDISAAIDSLYLSDVKVTIGARNEGIDKFMKSSIDDVRIYNRALSEPEIKTLYNSYNPKIKMKTSLPKIKLCGGINNK